MPSVRETITSRGNPLLKRLRAAGARGPAAAQGCSLAESPLLLEEALRSDVEIERVFASETARDRVSTRLPPHRGIPLHPVADRLFSELATTQRNQGVLALVKLPVWTPADVFQGLTVALDGVQDPGNAGTIARSAEAFGASGVVFLKGSAAPTNPKALRASAGSLFRLPFLAGLDAGAFLELARSCGKALVAADARGDVTLPEAALSGRSAVVIGSEAHGIAPGLRAAATLVRIPMRGAESLNAAAAAVAFLYEYARP